MWQPFIYHAIDVRKHPALPSDWAEQMVDVARACAKTVILNTSHVTSREDQRVQKITTKIVGGSVVKERLPWLDVAYRNELCKLGSLATGKTLYPAQSVDAGVVLNVMDASTGRYEAHADSNPVQGMLYAHVAEGGELVVAHDLSALGVEQIEVDASIVAPASGHQLYFDGRRPHYVRAITGNGKGPRVAAAMNYYYGDYTEASSRPSDLTQYLGGLETANDANSNLLK